MTPLSDLLSAPSEAPTGSGDRGYLVQGRTRRRGGEVLPWAAVLGVVVLVGLLTNGATLFFWENVAVEVLFAVSANLLFAYTNLPSFGQAAFFGTGAYLTATLAGHVPLVITIGASMAAAAVVAMVIGTVSVRAHGIVFANVTLAVGQGLYLLAFDTSLVGGENGKMVAQAGSWSQRDTWMLVAGCVVLSLIAYRMITLSPLGVVLMAIRDDPKRLLYLGVNVQRYRVMAFTLAAVGAGLAGCLFAFASGIVTPDTLYWTQSGYPIVMILIGGMDYFWGPAIGALLVTYLLQATTGHGGVDLLIIGGVLVAALLFARNGILGLFETVQVRVLARRSEGQSS